MKHLRMILWVFQESALMQWRAECSIFTRVMQEDEKNLVQAPFVKGSLYAYLHLLFFVGG